MEFAKQALIERHNMKLDAFERPFKEEFG